MIQNLVSILVACLGCVFSLSPYTVHADSLSRYVAKYKNIELSNEQLRKVSRYNHLIEYYSSIAYIKPKHKVNPDFIRALMLAESNGESRAVSSKGARGLCQIMYSTGKMAAKELAEKNLNIRYVSRRRLENLKPRDLFSPSVNLLLTCYLISKYNSQFQGKLDLVVAAWNAGENSIKNGRAPNYQETLNLIGKVNGYFRYFIRR